MNSNFIAGVVEGFYGQPWTQRQRFTLFEQLAEWGLNTYFYSPKDDLKHRAIWRERYDEHELARMAELVSECGRHALRFVYGLSPGLDIRFSSREDIELVKSRFQQLIEIGVRHFALLFDDLPGSIEGDDGKAFDSVASAQCTVANEVFGWIAAQPTAGSLLFCPTPYCDRMDRWQLGGEGYLDTIGASLSPEIGFLWTGPEIISREIDAASIRGLVDRIGRAPVIWDNLHANDYDMRRVYCGPYCGRSAEVFDLVAGVLVNPNNEFWLNYVPLSTMARCCQRPDAYDRDTAFRDAVRQWTSTYETATGRSIATEDLQLLAECYYLPYEAGSEAKRLNSLIARLVREPVESWGGQYDAFLAYHARIDSLFERFTELSNRELFYAWSRRIWELREEMDLVKDYLSWKKVGGDVAIGFVSETHLAGTYRGGIAAEMQRLLSFDEQGRIGRSAL